MPGPPNRKGELADTPNEIVIRAVADAESATDRVADD
jgi:hypothetical protein